MPSLIKASEFLQKLKISSEKTWVLGFITILLLIGLRSLRSTEGPHPTNESPEDVTTHIPAGFVLAPIQVANFESLDSILGQTGVVDLFSAATEKDQEPRLVVRQIRILRSPNNPSQFAVLTPESKAREIVQHSGSFFAVVQNPKSRGTYFEKTRRLRPPSKGRIHLEDL